VIGEIKKFWVKKVFVSGELEKKFLLQSCQWICRSESCVCVEQGCQIFLGTTNQSGEKYTRISTKIPNGHKMCMPKWYYKYQTAMEYDHCATPSR
jgi:hypothetical protein